MTQDAPERSEQNTGASPEEFAAVLKSIEVFAPLVKGFLGAQTGGEGQPSPPSDACARREALLCALKPYCSPSRCAAADYLIRLWRVGDAIKAIRKGGE